MRAFSTADWLATVAGVSAGIACLAGFVPGVYRDPPSLIAQSHGQDLATLVVVLPVLALSLRGSWRGRLLARGALGYLLYTYATYAVVAVLNPVTVLYIATVGCASWSLLFWPAQLEVAAPSRLPRRMTAVFLFALVVVFGLLWLSQMLTAAITGERPAALVEAGWPTSPIYVLDLAFVLPLCALCGFRLLRGGTATALVMPLLVFAALLSSGILAISVFASIDGQPLDRVQVGIFVLVTLLGGVLAWLGLTPGAPALAQERRSDSGPARLGGNDRIVV
jgi:hypothetical protein